MDTGGWLSSKKFVVPADKLYSSSVHTDDFEVNLTKAQIESFPPYDENAFESQDRWRNYETRYQSTWPATSTEGRTLERGRRWSAFQNRLRGDRDRIVAYIPDRERKVS